jgi:hypothetical protein
VRGNGRLKVDGIGYRSSALCMLPGGAALEHRHPYAQRRIPQAAEEHAERDVEQDAKRGQHLADCPSDHGYLPAVQATSGPRRFHVCLGAVAPSGNSLPQS